MVFTVTTILQYYHFHFPQGEANMDGTCDLLTSLTKPAANTESDEGSKTSDLHFHVSSSLLETTRSWTGMFFAIPPNRDTNLFLQFSKERSSYV